MLKNEFAVLLRKVSVVAGIWLLTTGIAAFAAELPDLPPCDALVANGSPSVSLGVVQPYAMPEVMNYAVKLATQSEQVTVCSEAWSEVVPHLVPWSRHLERGYGFGMFALTFFGVVAVLNALIPRQRWRRTTLLGVLVVGGLTWLGGMLILAGFHAVGGQRLFYGTVISLREARRPVAEWLDVSGARELEAELERRNLLKTMPATTSNYGAITPLLSGHYRAFHRLNLREKPGVESLRLAVISTGAKVVFDGADEGDWWRVRTESGQVGWVSSIWLRRPDEPVPSGP
ncbi:MAG: SH3 domain-containing protein [Desulfobulbia bacterium]